MTSIPLSRLAHSLFRVVVLSSLLCTGSVYSQSSPPTASAFFQNAVLTGSGNTVTATWIPVVTSTGTILVNLTIQFDVDPSGNLTVSAGFPQQIPAPIPLVSGFVPGTYSGPATINNGSNVVSVSGPGATVGGVTMWSLSSAVGASAYTYPATATWYTGPITSSPLAARLSKLGITSPFYSYGTTGNDPCGCHATWPSNALIGISQTGNTITIVSFTNNNGDQSQPVDQITYTPKVSASN